MRTKGIIYEKSKEFSLNIIALCGEMREKGEYIMSKQILKSGTSIGANYCEALGAESPHHSARVGCTLRSGVGDNPHALDGVFRCGGTSDNRRAVARNAASYVDNGEGIRREAR